MKKILLLINLLLLLQMSAYAQEFNKPCKYKNVLEKRKQLHSERELQRKQAQQEWQEKKQQIYQNWIKKKKQMHEEWQNKKRQMHEKWMQERNNH